MNRLVVEILWYFTVIISSTCVFAVNHFSGITVSNSKGGASTYTCRTQTEWNDLAKSVKADGFGSLRILGFDCEALERASAAAAAVGIKVLAGIYIPGTISSGVPAINEELKSFRDAYAKYGSGRYSGLTIGNEVNDAPFSIIAEVYRARDYLRRAGVSTLVSTAHTWVNIKNNPTLCGSDFVAANAHAFFDGHIAPEGAGNFVTKVVVPALRAACPGKNIIITETGWPSRGPPSGTSSASTSAERLALINLNCAARDLSSQVQFYAFEYDDQIWKGNANERSFGIFGKPAVKNDVFTVC